MKKQTLTILALAGVAWWLLKKNRRASGSDVLDNATEPLIAPERERVGKLSDPVVSYDNIRRGIDRGWYKAEIMHAFGNPVVCLWGKDANGNNYGDHYPITEETYQALKRDGIRERN